MVPLETEMPNETNLHSEMCCFEQFVYVVKMTNMSKLKHA